MRKWWSRSQGSTESLQSFSIIQHFGCLSTGIWSAALNGDLGRVKYFIQKAADPSQPDSAGYTALVSWGGKLALGIPALSGGGGDVARAAACSSLPAGFEF